MKEFDLIARICQLSSDGQSPVDKSLTCAAADNNNTNKYHNILNSKILIGPGDDMALLQLTDTKNNNTKILCAVDQVIDGEHIRLEVVPVELAGRKAVTRCLSDVAAMAGIPIASLATAYLPADFTEDKAMQLFIAMRETANQYGCPLIGGDIALASSPETQTKMVCTVTVLAQPDSTNGGIVTSRAGAGDGDAVYVTGLLGGSYIQKTGMGKHLTFEPRIDFALELVKQIPVNAMIDISDGLGRDLDHIAEMSKLNAVIFADKIPCSAGCNWQQAISDGEDYELCFTTNAEVVVPKSILDVPITRIGYITAMPPDTENSDWRTVLKTPEGKSLDISKSGWEHVV